MKRRIMAWVLLIGFILLFVDLVFIGFMRPLAATIYIILALTFILFGRRFKV